MADEWIIYLPCLMVINSVVMVVNFFVIAMFLVFCNELLSVNNNKLLFSLAVSDCLVGLFGIIGNILHYLSHKGLVDFDISQVCGTLPLFGSFFVSVLSLGAMTVDRYISVVYSLRYHSIMTESRVNVVICFTWLVVAVILVIQGTILLGVSSSLELLVRTYQLSAFFISGVSVLFVGNLKLYLIIRKKKQKGTVTETQNTELQVDIKLLDTIMSGRTTQFHKNMPRIVTDNIICFWMVAIFVICWLPMTVYYVTFANGYADPSTCYL